MSQHLRLPALLRHSSFRLTWRQRLPISIQASLPPDSQVREQHQRSEAYTSFRASCQAGHPREPQSKVGPGDAISLMFMA